MRLLGLVVFLLVAGCSPASDSSGGKLRIVTTVSPITNIAANIAGDTAIVTGVVPEGSNSHTFEPPPGVAKVLAQADVVFVNGLGLEEPIVELAKSIMPADADLVRLGEQTLRPDQYIYDFSFPLKGGKPNPHLWTSPRLATEYAQRISTTLKLRDPGNRENYERNFKAYDRKLATFDATLKNAIAPINVEERKLLTYHDAYAYFAQDYFWKVIGAVQVADFREPGPEDVARLIRQIRRENVPAIFGSEVFPSPILEQIARETGAKYVDDLRDDDLPGQTGDRDHTYIELMKFNYVTIIRAFGADTTDLEAVDGGNVVRDTATYAR